MLPDYRVRQRDFLLEISRAITAQLDLGEVLRRVLNASVVMLAGQVGMIALREANGEYQIRATVGLDSSRVPALNEKLRDLMSGIDEGRHRDVVDAKIREMIGLLDQQLRQYIALPTRRQLPSTMPSFMSASTTSGGGWARSCSTAPTAS
jgi:GAF domain-containing protein